MTSPKCWRVSRRFTSESGQAAGIETIPFGIMVFIGGMLLMVNAWAVVDTRAALDSAARDYLRAYTAAPTAETGRSRGEAAVHSTLNSRTSAERQVRIIEPSAAFGPCRPATVRLEITLAAIHAPFVGSIGSTTVSTTQTELVQPYGDAVDEGSGATVCDG